MTTSSESPSRAVAAAEQSGVAFDVVRHAAVNSLQEAAEARGVEPRDVLKTLVVRKGEDDFLFVLVPGDRTIGWAKLRALLEVNRITMADAHTARAVTGYERGTITPFGSLTPLPVVADERIKGRRVTLGAGEHNAALALVGDALLEALKATAADVTDPEQSSEGGASA